MLLREYGVVACADPDRVSGEPSFFSGLVTAAVGLALMMMHAEPPTIRLTAGLFAMGLFWDLYT